MKIVFVCTGNTCRSPMAEGFLKMIAQKNGDESFEVVSRGICAAEGESASEFSQKACKELGTDISAHISVQLTIDDIADSDYVITLTTEQCVFLKNELKKFADKIYSISEFTGLNDIADPYGGSFEIYKKCSEDIFEASKIIYKKISGKDI